METAEGNCARVNGDLAVCLGFGDGDYKKTGGPGPEDRPVTVDPELKEFECDATDILMLVCDGVSEGQFPNPEVTQLVGRVLKESDDPGSASKAVCHKAVATDSKDNISCMIVLLDGAEKDREETEFLPGSVEKLGNATYKKAYATMAAKADLILPEAVEQRYDLLQLSKEEFEKLHAPAITDGEVAMLGKPAGDKGSEERKQWYEKFLEHLPEEKEEGPGGMDMSSLMGGKGGGKGGKGGKGKEQLGDENDGAEKDENGYSWSQQGDEVQITFKLPKAATKQDVKVAFKLKTISVAASGESLLDGALMGEVDVDDCNWCLASGGSELQVMLTKKKEASWKSLLK